MGKYYEVELDEQLEVSEPKKFKVLLLNDDHSTMEFVLEILTTVFRKDISTAEQIMLNIHNNGKEICGIYSHEIASTKIAQVRTLAKKQAFPIKAVMEEE